MALDVAFDLFSPTSRLSLFPAVLVNVEQQQSDWAQSPPVMHVLLEKLASGA